MRRTAKACACWSIGGGSEGRAHRVPRRCDFDLSEPYRWWYSSRAIGARERRVAATEGWYSQMGETGQGVSRRRLLRVGRKMAHTHAQLHLLAKAEQAGLCSA